jgi:YfiH family protein
MAVQLDFVEASWPAPSNIRAVVSTRTGGFSTAPYESLNLGDHVGDDAGLVWRNRAKLREALGLGVEPFWLTQVHGTKVIDAGSDETQAAADGSYAEIPGPVCAILTADCLPVFLCDRWGTKVALLHAGWRGLVSGVIEAGVLALRTAGADLLAWLGPAIGPDAYRVGDDVRDAFAARDPGAGAAFRPDGAGKWRADLYMLARARLAAAGVAAVYGGEHCTFHERERFFSYRRDGVTGRMASLIWLDEARTPGRA